MRVWIALLSLLLVGFTGTGVTITGGNVNVVAGGVTCVEEIAIDSFSTGSIGTDWTTSGVDTDQTNCPWSIDTGAGELRWDSAHASLCDNNTYSVLNDTTVSTAHQWACMTFVTDVGPSSRYGIVLRATSSDESTLLTHVYFVTGNTDHRHRENESVSEVCTGIDTGGPGDELCVEISGTGTEEVVNYWKNPVAGDPDDFGTPDCSITDMTGTNDTGGFIGIHFRSGNATETNNSRMDLFRGGSCSPS